MGRILRNVLTATAVIMLVYIGAQYWLGRQIESETNRWAVELATQPGVELRQLEYDRQLTSGTLYYDLTVAAGAPILQEYLPAWLAFAGDEAWELQGHVEVVHGPWIADQGFGVAEGVWELESNPGVRAIFPDTDAAAPLATIRLMAGFSDTLRLTITASDYDGRIVVPESSEIARLTLSGLEAQVDFNREVSHLSSTLGLQEFNLSQVDAGELVTASMSGVHVTGQWQRQDGLWSGETDAYTEQTSLSRPGSHFRILNAHQNTAIQNHDGVLQIDQRVKADALETNIVALGPVDVAVSTGGIDSRAYLALLDALEGNTAVHEAAQQEALEALLRTDPWVAIERVSVGLNDSEAVAFSGRLQVTGATSLQDVPAATSGAGELRLGADLLRSLVVTLFMGEETLTLSAADRELAVEEAYQMFLDSLALVPGLEITEQYVGGSFDIEEGDLLVAGQPVLNLFTAFFPIDSGAQSSSLSDVALAVTAAPLYGTLSMSDTGNREPVIAEIVAGGSDWLDGLFLGSRGLCVGFVNADQPDLVFNYQGSGDLYISVESVWDTTLVVRSPDGDWHCNDDAPGLGLNPALDFQPAINGDYTVWIGTYEATLAEAAVRFAESSPQP